MYLKEETLVPTKYVHIKSTTCPSSELGLSRVPTPFSPASVPLPPETGGRGHTSLRVAKRIEYKEATLRFGRRRLLNFEVFKGLHRKERGGGGGTGLCLMAAILLAGILTLSTQLATCLSILKEINTTL